MAPAAADAMRGLLRSPAAAAAEARARMDRNIAEWLDRLPRLEHPDPRVVRFYRHAAMQLLWARWKLGKGLALDPWYATSGRDSGAVNAYAWDLQYSAATMAVLDPRGDARAAGGAARGSAHPALLHRAVARRRPGPVLLLQFLRLHGVSG